jgi:DNA-directed RNA polymerase specialized sigma24 family protein
MNKDWFLSQEAFDALLDWLDSDREQAGIKYEDIRGRLIMIFSGRGCVDAEDLADETINRVTQRLSTIRKEFTGDPTRYFYGVANFVCMEYMRRKPPQPSPFQPSDSDQVELEYRCLEQCIDSLSEENRYLLLKYYGGEGRSKIDQRRQLSEELKIAPNALRIRAYRIRQALQECVEKCIERSQE